MKDKLSGELTTKEIMEKYGIKNKSQVATWMRWYRIVLMNSIDLISQSENNIPMDMVLILRVRMTRQNDKCLIRREKRKSLKKVHRDRKRVEKEVVIKIVEFLRKKYAFTESFHLNLKAEESKYVKFNSPRDHEVYERVLNYLNYYYYEERIQEKLGYLTPINTVYWRQPNQGVLYVSHIARSVYC